MPFCELYHRKTGTHTGNINSRYDVMKNNRSFEKTLLTMECKNGKNNSGMSCDSKSILSLSFIDTSSHILYPTSLLTYSVAAIIANRQKN